MGLQIFTCLTLLGSATLISGRFVFPLNPVETSTGFAADYYLRGNKPAPLESSAPSVSHSPSADSAKDDLESSHASPIGTRVSGRSNERIQETPYQPADPYNFGYDIRDDYGNRQYRKEESDAAGTVRGSYGYTDANGLFRIVEYVADVNGFRANIKTNEPGTGHQQAADIVLAAENPPKAILEAASAPKPVTEKAPREVTNKQTESSLRVYERSGRPRPVPAEQPTYLYRTALPLPTSNPSSPSPFSSSTSVSTSTSSSSSAKDEKERQ